MLVQFLDDAIDADGQIRRWRVDRAGLIEAVRYAQSFYVECTANDPFGFEYVVSYAKAGRFLRDTYAGYNGWAKDDAQNQTAIKNDDLKIRIHPCNFCSLTANPSHSPSNISEKGTAARENTRCNEQLSFFDIPEVLHDVSAERNEYTTLLLGMNFESDFLKAELSLPVKFNKGRLTRLSIRVPLLDGEPPKDVDVKLPKSPKPSDVFGEVDIAIGRKA